MNNETYKNNMQSLEDKYPEWAEFLKKNTRKRKKAEVIAEESLGGEKIFKVKLEDRTLYLNGKYAPDGVVDRWLEQVGKIEEFATIVIVGLSNGAHVKRIMEAKPPKVAILVYEPSFDVFRKAMQEMDLRFLFQPDIPVGLIVETINGDERELYFKRLISYDNMVFLKTYISGNYIELFEKEVGEFIHELNYHVFSINVGWNTTARYTVVNAKNLFYNLRYLYNNYSLLSLFNLLPPEIPTIIVSAGPSLNKNIYDLKKAVGKACIIATDTAMKPLLNAGIRPNFFMIIDGLKPGILFEHKDISKIPMVTMTGVSIEPMKLHKGKKFFYMSGALLEGEIIKKAGLEDGLPTVLYNLPTGGSVATSAFSMGLFMGSKKIILVGQDLALTNNRTHADGTFQEKMDEIKMDTGEYMDVPSIDGGMIRTRNDLKLYLGWFERNIKELPSDHVVVDATEGGALIQGAKNMTLSKAIQRYCKKKYNINWYVARRPKLLKEKGEEIVLEQLEKVPERLENVRKQAKIGKGYYEKLIKIAKKRNASQQEIRKLFNKIEKINKFMESDCIAQTVLDSLKGLEYGLRPLIYQMQEDSYDELKDIADYGKAMLTAVIHAGEELREMAEDTIIPFTDEKRKQMKGEI